MIEIFKNPRYDFIGKRKWAYIVSALVTLIGLVSLATQGLRYDIDFTGGTLVQVRFEKTPSVAAIRAGLNRINLGESIIQEFGHSQEFIIRLPLAAGSDSQQTAKRIEAALSQEPSLGKFEVRRVEFVGPQVGKLPRSAIDAGFNRALRTIIDTHLTVMVTALILYNFGTGPVKGFAVSLFVGLAASLFTAYFFTRLLFDLVYMRRTKGQTVSI